MFLPCCLTVAVHTHLPNVQLTYAHTMLALAPMNSGIFLYNLFFTSVSHKQATATEITILSFCSTSPLGTLRFPVLGQLELLNKTHGRTPSQSRTWLLDRAKLWPASMASCNVSKNKSLSELPQYISRRGRTLLIINFCEDGHKIRKCIHASKGSSFLPQKSQHPACLAG